MKIYVVTVLAAVLALTAHRVEAQKTKTSPVSKPATAVLRCAVNDPVDCPNTLSTAVAVPDGVRSDGLGAYAPPPGGTPSTTSGAWLDTLNEFSLQLLGETARFVWLDFRNTLVAPSCGTGCRKHFDILTLTNAWIHTNTVDSLGNEASAGLYSIPVGGSGKARLKMTFDTVNAAGVTIQWAVRYNPTGFPGSDHVTITRPAQNVWVVEASEFDRGRLVSPALKGRGVLDEGTYAMPFKIIMTIP